MIYWINGAYGVGKSTIAECLKKKLTKAHIFDAEEVERLISKEQADRLRAKYFYKRISYKDTKTKKRINY